MTRILSREASEEWPKPRITSTMTQTGSLHCLKHSLVGAIVRACVHDGLKSTIFVRIVGCRSTSQAPRSAPSIQVLAPLDSVLP